MKTKVKQLEYEKVLAEKAAEASAVSEQTE